MGQNPSVSMSSYSGTNGDLGQVQTRLQAHLTILRSLARVSYTEIVSCIDELNTVTRSFTDRSGKQLQFTIRRGTDTTFLWKATIRIACLKINTSTSSVESSRLLTLRQFVVIYREITEQVAALSRPGLRLDEIDAEIRSNGTQSSSQSRLDEFTTSTYVPSQSRVEELKASTYVSDQATEKGSPKSEKQLKSCLEDVEASECCVCMDRKACIMLSCCHEFCEICIDNWTRDESHSTCPLCRTKVEGADDAWVLTDEQEPGDYEREVKGYLVGLADRMGRANNNRQSASTAEEGGSSVDEGHDGDGVDAEGDDLDAEGGGLDAEGGGLDAEDGGLDAGGGGLEAEGGGLDAEGEDTDEGWTGVDISSSPEAQGEQW